MVGEPSSAPARRRQHPGRSSRRSHGNDTSSSRRTPKTGPTLLRAVPAHDHYPHVRAIPTRWKDNDVYGHVNNVEYYSYFDTVINAWLVEQGGLDIRGGPVIGLCAESHCEFRAALAFPETVQAALRVAHLGRSSVRYEIALFG